MIITHKISSIQRMLVFTITICLLSSVSAFCAETNTFKFDKDGSFYIEAPGLPKVKGSLFLWHDDWKYATPSSVTFTEPDSWSGNMPEPGVTSGHISYTQNAKPSLDDGMDISLEFHKNGDIKLNRGIFMLIEFPTYEMSGQTIAFTHGPPYLTSDGYHTSAKGFSANLNESKALEFTVDRACTFEHRGKEGESLMNIRLLPDADGKVNVKLRIKPAIDTYVTWQTETHEAKLAINNVTLSAEQIPRYSMLELTVDLSATYDNYFDPDDVNIDALFASPSGRKITVPGFVYQGFKAEQEEDQELLNFDDKLVWKVRFTPTDIGDYSVLVNAKDRTGRIKSDEKKFTCIDSDSKGFVKISRPFVKVTTVTRVQDSKSKTKSSKKESTQKASEPKDSVKTTKPPADNSPIYFLLDNGETLFLIGHNIPTYHPEIEDYFKKMEAVGENYTRLWMYSTALGLEWGQPVGFYRLDEAWKLDKVLEAASRHGIYIMLCFDTHQDFREEWGENSYYIKLGGPCKTPLDYFRDINARKLYKNRLRYIAARWSAYPNVLAWEFMNEMEGVEGSDKNRPVVTKWITEMSKVLQNYDPYNHPISSSLWTTAGWPELWKLSEMDFVQSHFYANTPMDMAQEVENICNQKHSEYPDKLHLFGEYGIMSGDGTAKSDPMGVHLHNGNWAGLMSGSASVPVSWWHESYIDPLNLYNVYKGIANFISDEKDLAKQTWKPLNAAISYEDTPEQTTYRELQFTGKGDNWKKPDKIVFAIKEDGTVDDVSRLPSLLHGNAHSSIRKPITFQVNYPVAGKFILRIGKVGENGLLKVTLDGKEVASVDLPTGKGLGVSSEYAEQWKRWETTYNKDVEIEVPAGKHEIQIRNDGNDWIAIDYILLTNYLTNVKPNLRVLGIQTSDRALIWVQNKDYTWFKVRDNAQINSVPPVRLTLSGFANGTYKLELWDTANGVVIEQKETTVTDSTLSYDLPEVKQDYALKIKGGW